MNEKTILTIAGSCSMVGVILLYLFLHYSTFPDSQINTLAQDDIDEIKQFNGSVQDVQTKGNTTFITLKQTHTIDLILFNTGNIDLKYGQKIRVKGKIEEYKGHFEILAEKIEIIE